MFHWLQFSKEIREIKAPRAAPAQLQLADCVLRLSNLILGGGRSYWQNSSGKGQIYRVCVAHGRYVAQETQECLIRRSNYQSTGLQTSLINGRLKKGGFNERSVRYIAQCKSDQ